MLTLSPVTSENWRLACFLSTDPEHKAPLDEEWITSNAFSMLQAIYDPNWTCRLISDGDLPVGFVFFGMWEEKQAPLFCRFMIDIDHQSKGFGTQAIPLILEEMYALYGQCDIYLTLERENTRAVHLYEKFGFRPTGEVDCGEEIYLLPYPKKEN